MKICFYFFSTMCELLYYQKRYYQVILYAHPHWFISVASSVITNAWRDQDSKQMSSIIMTYMPAYLHLYRKKSFKNILVVVLIQIRLTSLKFLQSHLSLIPHYLKTGVARVTFYNARSASQMEIGVMQPYGTA